MSDNHANKYSSYISVLIIIALGIILFLLSFYRLRDPDIWMYLSSGKFMVETHQILEKDIFSYTRGGTPWINHSWGAQTLLYLGWKSLGLGGLYLIRWGLLAGAFGGIYLCVRRYLNPVPAGFLVLWGILGASQRFVVRPELFTFLGLSWLLYLLDGPGKRYFLIPLLMLLWANLHGGFVIGLGVIGIWILGMGIERVWKKSPFPSRILLWGAAGLLLSMLTPNGPKGIFYSSNIGALKNFIYVWQPFFSGGPSSWSLSQWLFPLLAIWGAVTFLASRSKTRISLLLIFLAFIGLGLQANRNIFIFALIWPVVAASNLRNINFPRWSVGVVGPAFLLGGLISWIYPRWISDPYGANIHSNPGWGICRTVFPIKTSKFIQEEGLEARLFNSFGIGSYLIWQLWPGHEIFVDTRLGVFGPDFLLEYNRVLVNPSTFDNLQQRWGFHLALVDHANPSNRHLLRWLADSREWGLTFYDSNSALFLSRRFPGSDRIAAAGLTEAKNMIMEPREAAQAGKFLLSIGHLTQARARLEEAARHHPDSPHINALLARAWAETGNRTEALRYCRIVAELENNPSIRLLAAHLFLLEKRYSEAVQAAKQALEDNPELPEGFAFLGDLYAGTNQEDLATKAYRKALERQEISPASAMIAGRIHLTKGEHSQAAQYFQIPLPSDPSWPQARISLAGCWARDGEKNRAMEIYRKGIIDFPYLADTCRYNLAVLLKEENRDRECQAILADISNPGLKQKAQQELQ